MRDLEDILAPSNLFKSEEEFIDFLEIESTVEDLEYFLKACEEEELYEYCSKIQKKKLQK
jgi:hypothetical protein